ncbi:unnamed protein product [Urochloa humidicola]
MPLPLELHNSNIAGAMTGEFVDAGLAGSDASHQLARLLFAVGFLTMLLDLATTQYKAPRWGGLQEPQAGLPPHARSNFRLWDCRGHLCFP